MRSKWRIQLQAGVGLDQLPGWAGVRVVSAEAPAPDCLDVVVEATAVTLRGLSRRGIGGSRGVSGKSEVTACGVGQAEGTAAARCAGVYVKTSNRR